MSARRRCSRTVPTSVEVREQWPLHWLIWEGKEVELEAVLKEGEVNKLASSMLSQYTVYTSQCRHIKYMCTYTCTCMVGTYLEC